MNTIPVVQGQYFPSLPLSQGQPSRLLDPGYGPPPPQRHIAPPTLPPGYFPPKQPVAQNGDAYVGAHATAAAGFGDESQNPFLRSDVNNVLTKLSYLQYNINENRYAIDWMYDRILIMRSWNNQMQYNLNDAQSALRTLSGRIGY